MTLKYCSLRIKLLMVFWGVKYRIFFEAISELLDFNKMQLNKKFTNHNQSFHLVRYSNPLKLK
jgi:hypothetical protein